MAEGEVIYAENLSDNPLYWKWANQRYTLHPHIKVIVPWEAMCLYMGNPDAMDRDERRRYRTDEFRRIQFKHGVHDGNLALWEENKPRVKCQTLQMEEDEYIVTVADDPEGLGLDATKSNTVQSAMLADRVLQLEAELKSLRRATSVQERAEEAERVGRATEDADPDEPEDIDEVIQRFEAPNPRPPSSAEVIEDTPVQLPAS